MCSAAGSTVETTDALTRAGKQMPPGGGFRPISDAATASKAPAQVVAARDAVPAVDGLHTPGPLGAPKQSSEVVDAVDGLGSPRWLAGTSRLWHLYNAPLSDLSIAELARLFSASRASPPPRPSRGHR